MCADGATAADIEMEENWCEDVFGKAGGSVSRATESEVGVSARPGSSVAATAGDVHPSGWGLSVWSGAAMV